MYRGWIGDHRTMMYPINGVLLELPLSHALPAYQAKWAAYDEPLRLLAEAVRELRSDATAIDIGANVGDSAAAISCDKSGATRLPVLCIEGDPKYLPFLRKNVQTLGSLVEIDECFVGESSGTVSTDALTRHDGTSSAADTLAAMQHDSKSGLPGPRIAVCRLEQVVARHPRFRDPTLVKTDTDGYDFAILLAHRDLLSQSQPVLYFEFAVDSEESDRQARMTLEMLVSVGYDEFLVFDNFGNPMLRTRDRDQVSDVARYLRSHQNFGQAVFYADVCAVSAANRDVLGALDSKLDHLIRGRAPRPSA